MSYFSDFIPLATVNKTFFSRLDPAIVPSVEPLLHLIPEHVLQKRLIENQWSYASCDDLPQKDLTPLYLFSPLQPTAMEVITSLPSLESLSVVVYGSFDTLPYNITSFEIMLRRSLLFGVFNNNGFDAAISLLHALPIPCHFITSLAQEFDITNHPNFSAVDVRRLSFQLQWKLEIVEYLKTLDMLFRSANNLQCPRFGSYKGTTWDSWTSKGRREFHGVFHKETGLGAQLRLQTVQGDIKVEVENQMWHHSNFGL
ncbi:hypothetical protein F4604DRAFT_1686153 [Suillus subluteus]|nr:hypothetical protein F4604DRAFT_1686153 [Suillus subluteus]